MTRGARIEMGRLGVIFAFRPVSDTQRYQPDWRQCSPTCPIAVRRNRCRAGIDNDGWTPSVAYGNKSPAFRKLMPSTTTTLKN